jgi:hypothetical protein
MRQDDAGMGLKLDWRDHDADVEGVGRDREQRRRPLEDDIGATPPGSAGDRNDFMLLLGCLELWPLLLRALGLFPVLVLQATAPAQPAWPTRVSRRPDAAMTQVSILQVIEMVFCTSTNVRRADAARLLTSQRDVLGLGQTIRPGPGQPGQSG